MKGDHSEKMKIQGTISFGGHNGRDSGVGEGWTTGLEERNVELERWPIIV